MKIVKLQTNALNIEHIYLENLNDFLEILPYIEDRVSLMKKESLKHIYIPACYVRSTRKE